MSTMLVIFMLLAAVIFSGCTPTTPPIPGSDAVSFNSPAPQQPSLEQYNQNSQRGQTMPQQPIQQQPNPQQVLPTLPPQPTPSPTPVGGQFPKKPPATEATATIKTAKGDITVKLYSKEAPNTVANFIEKAQSGFYKNLKFHRVEDWVIQGGDPEGTGRGGGEMPTELNDKPFKVGSLGVARAGNIKISNDSQFFICTADCSWLDNQYTNFGEVTVGIDVAKSVAIGDIITEINIQ